MGCIIATNLKSLNSAMQITDRNQDATLLPDESPTGCSLIETRNSLQTMSVGEKTTCQQFGVCRRGCFVAKTKNFFWGQSPNQKSLQMVGLQCQMREEGLISIAALVDRAKR